MKKYSCIKYYKDGRESWSNGIGNFLRLRGLSLTTVASIVTVSTPLWYTFINEKFSLKWEWITKSTQLDLTINHYHFIAILLLIFLLYLYEKRRRVIYSAYAKYHIHQIIHKIRNTYVDQKQSGDVNIVNFTTEVSSLIGAYFSHMAGESKNIGVAIRIATMEDNELKYRTQGRYNLHLGREDTSYPIGTDSQEIKLLRSAEGMGNGLYYYKDLSLAKKQNIYDYESVYGHEIGSMMLAPINGWDGKGKNMIGILYITSPKKRGFGEQYTDVIGVVSDSLAEIYSEIVY